jgi:hypothetical protein
MSFLCVKKETLGARKSIEHQIYCLCEHLEEFVGSVVLRVRVFAHCFMKVGESKGIQILEKGVDIVPYHHEKIFVIKPDVITASLLQEDFGPSASP